MKQDITMATEKKSIEISYKANHPTIKGTNSKPFQISQMQRSQEDGGRSG
jgi:hypothetical protein